MSDALDREAFLDDLARTRWATLAKHAWRLYQDRGRGALLYPMESTQAMQEGERTPLRYLTFNNDEAAKSSPFSMLHHLVETYDPKRQVVIVVQFPDDSTAFDVYERSPAPPSAE